MVAISLYRGNLHKVPDVPRRWLMPKHTISVKDFKLLVRKREKALSLLRPTTTIAIEPSNPNPSLSAEPEIEFVADNGCSKQNLQITVYQAAQPSARETTDTVVNSKTIKVETVNEDSQQNNRIEKDAKDQSRSNGVTRVEEQRKGIGDSLSSPGTKSAAAEGGCYVKDGDNEVLGALQPPKEEDKQPKTSEDPAVEIKNTDLQISDKEKKKIDLEEKLKDLNERKHKLVQMLKQILNAEEEIKRRSNTPVVVVSAPSASHQVDSATNVLNKIGADAANCFADLEGESEDNNNNTNGRQLNQQQILLHSPTPPSPPRKITPTITLVPSPTSGPCQTTTTTTTSTGVVSSPSRFAPLSGNPPFGNLTPILSTMSGTHCTTSSPSPVASGGTSVFRDPRITSPSWS